MAESQFYVLFEPEFDGSGRVRKVRAARVTSRLPYGEAEPGSLVAQFRVTLPDAAFISPEIHVEIPESALQPLVAIAVEGATPDREEHE